MAGPSAFVSFRVLDMYTSANDKFYEKVTVAVSDRVTKEVAATALLYLLLPPSKSTS